jgi:hypothetical protein
MIKFNLKFNGSAFNAAVRVVTQRTIRSFLTRVGEKMRFLMRLPKKGKGYGPNLRSAPDEAPAIQTGKLIRSIGAPTVSGLRGQIRVSASYAAYLEEGTKFLEPRPFAKVAAEGVLKDINGPGTLRNLL